MCPRFGLAQCGRDRIGGSLRVNVVAGLLEDLFKRGFQRLGQQGQPGIGLTVHQP